MLAENINSQLRVLINVSNGYANFERFRTRALFCFNPYITFSLTQHLSSNKREGRTKGSYNKHTNSVFDATCAKYENYEPDDSSEEE